MIYIALHVISVAVVALVLTQVAAFATSIYLHRTLAHRSIVMKPGAELFFRFVLWIVTGLSRLQWVSVHRKHHAFTDEKDDPHSPWVLGFWKVQLFNVYYYSIEANNPETIAKYGRGIENDAWERYLFGHKYFKYLGITLGTSALYMIMGWWGVAAALLHAVLYVVVLSSSINGLCHWWGWKNFEDNTATNIPLVAWFSGGEGWHNNHHNDEENPNFGAREGEFDPSWPIIKGLVSKELASLRRVQREMVG